MEDFAPVLAIVSIFIGLPWLVLHYVTKWKTGPALTNDDEAMLEELYQLARRLEERMETVERLVSADDDPHFRVGRPLPEEVTPIDINHTKERTRR